jgi:hypothetical protein
MTRKSESPAILSPVFHGIARRPTLLTESSLRVGRAAAEDLPNILLRREGIVLNHKKLYRLYREERLIVRKRGGRKRALGTRAPMALPQGLNRRWSLDFVSDARACGSNANRGKRAVHLHTVLLLHGGCTKICA